MQLSVAFGYAGLNKENISAIRGPGKSGSDSGHFGALGYFREIFPLAQIILEFIDSYAVRTVLTFGDSGSDTAADRTDLTFQRPDARLARMLRNDFFESLAGDLNLIFLKAVFINLLGDQVLPGDLYFFLQGITADVDDLHAVAQRRRDRIQR